jgi:hypothetical protein
MGRVLTFISLATPLTRVLCLPHMEGIMHCNRAAGFQPPGYLARKTAKGQYQGAAPFRMACCRRAGIVILYIPGNWRSSHRQYRHEISSTLIPARWLDAGKRLLDTLLLSLCPAIPGQGYSPCSSNTPAGRV